MKTRLHELLNQSEHAAYATDAGRRMHAKLQCVAIGDGVSHGDINIVKKINSCPGLADFFAATAMTEVPIAGYINGRFVSRRIDRLCVDDSARTVRILDYKTDTDHGAQYDKYMRQLDEYIQLVKKIYPGYNVYAYILWTHDWTLERIK